MIIVSLEIQDLLMIIVNLDIQDLLMIIVTLDICNPGFINDNSYLRNL